MYSAIKVNGKRLYEYARKGENVTLPKHLVEIKKINLLEYNNDSFTFEVLVSKGTYIRSLVRDIGNKLNVPAVMNSLVRTTLGDFKINSAYSIDDIKNGDFKLISIFHEIITRFFRLTNL